MTRFIDTVKHEKVFKVQKALKTPKRVQKKNPISNINDMVPVSEVKDKKSSNWEGLYENRLILESFKYE